MAPFERDDLLDSGETTAEKAAPLTTSPAPFEGMPIGPPITARRPPPSIRTMSSRPPPLPPPATQPSPQAPGREDPDNLAKTGEGEVSTPLSSTNETAQAPELDFPEETSIGTRPVFAPLYDEHTVLTHEHDQEAPADRSSEAIMVGDDEIEEEPQTLEGTAVPPRSVPPPFPRS
jgi:hypothetical protein